MHERTLPRPRQPDQSNTVTRFDFQIELVNRIAFGVRITHRDMLEDEVTLAGRQIHLALIRFVGFVERGKDAFGCHRHHHETRIDTREISKRRHQKKKRRQKGHEIPHGNHPLADLEHREREYQSNS